LYGLNVLFDECPCGISCNALFLIDVWSDFSVRFIPVHLQLELKSHIKLPKVQVTDSRIHLSWSYNKLPGVGGSMNSRDVTEYPWQADKMSLLTPLSDSKHDPIKMESDSEYTVLELSLSGLFDLTHTEKPNGYSVTAEQAIKWIEYHVGMDVIFLGISHWDDEFLQSAHDMYYQHQKQLDQFSNLHDCDDSPSDFLIPLFVIAINGNLETDGFLLTLTGLSLLSLDVENSTQDSLALLDKNITAEYYKRMNEISSKVDSQVHLDYLAKCTFTLKEHDPSQKGMKTQIKEIFSASIIRDLLKKKAMKLLG